MSDKPQAILRLDYEQPDYWVETIDLDFKLGEEVTIVTSTVVYFRNKDKQAATDLVLHGEQMKLISVSLDDTLLSADDYLQDEVSLTVKQVPERFCLTIVTEIKPQENKSLSGLYKSSGNFCTQCEAEGFRRITYYLDRPDVMAKYTTTITADKRLYPVLLSNGNLLEQGELDNHQHWVRWQDPFKKPSYLYALVAGDLVCVSDQFKTMSGRDIALKIYVEPGNEGKCDHAMASLKWAMRWDEEKYGREYDLDIFMLVAVDDFNMGAMENKGLNIFNSKYVLANQQTATDIDFILISLVVGHEYFHNWSGNRVTCRDWFQLSLKEGLTVFREQEFTRDVTSAAVKRIDDVTKLRTHQFPQDAGPIAHSVRPDSYIEINNFYTTTIYEKGAEVIRMMKQLLGDDGFRRGMDLYFERHDGQAVTCDDFVAALADANQYDFEQFKLWYCQAGTPQLYVSEHYDEAKQSYHLHVKQQLPDTPGQKDKQAMVIPLAMGLLDNAGAEIPLIQRGNAETTKTSTVLSVNQFENDFVFDNVKQRPVPSLLRGFSAPVKLHFDYSDDDLLHLLAHDTDTFTRWEAAQQLAMNNILRLINDFQAGKSLVGDANFVAGLAKVLTDPQLDKAFIARVFVLPSDILIAEQVDVIDPDAIYQARHFLKMDIGQRLASEFAEIYQQNRAQGEYQYTLDEVARRSLSNTCLGYLAVDGDAQAVSQTMAHYQQADNMTDTMAALSILNHIDCAEREQVLAEFYQQWQNETLVLDKWFALQAVSSLKNTVETVTELLGHEKFNLKNPNKVKALLASFAVQNLIGFHHPSGAGYRLLADNMIEIDKFNPLTAARIIEPLTRYQRLEPKRQALMKAELERVLEQASSKDMFEVVSKALA